MNYITNQLLEYQVYITIAFIVLFLCQIIFWLNYSRIANYRNKFRASSKELPPVSVIVVIQNDDYIDTGLPLLLAQEHPNFEIVVVNDNGGTDLDCRLVLLAKEYPRLKFTTLKKDDKFNHSRKIPLLIGIKAATHENIIITDTDAFPTNEKWLSYMCRGFSGAELVIGYTGFEIKRGIANKIIRCSRLSTSIRYLRSAIGGTPYRGIYNNIGYTKSAFFDNRGYTNLSMTIGEDDLFVQRITTTCNTSIIINPQSTLVQTQQGGIKWWWRERKYYSFSFRYFPGIVKLKTGAELTTRALFFCSAVALGTLSALDLITIPYFWAGVVGVFLIREVILYMSVKKIARRLGEIKIVWSFVLYDLISPIAEAMLAISRRISPPKSIWIQNSK